MRQLGNAVPVQLSEVIASDIMRRLVVHARTGSVFGMRVRTALQSADKRNLGVSVATLS